MVGNDFSIFVEDNSRVIESFSFIILNFFNIPKTDITSKPLCYLPSEAKLDSLPLPYSIWFSIFLILEIEADKSQLREADNINVITS